MIILMFILKYKIHMNDILKEYNYYIVVGYYKVRYQILNNTMGKYLSNTYPAKC